jgi:hypothetical protein
MHPAGQVFPHMEQPIQISGSTLAKHPFITVIAPVGHIFVQAPQATQRFSSTDAYFLDFI